ncbi:Topoisomerase 1-associated factor 1 [Phlyctochytrium planicorne]|nr:Topoisomerase 1-associated factor 1 [Phlyctochytrium planicorne]
MEKTAQNYLLSIVTALGGYEDAVDDDGELLSEKIYVPGDEVAGWKNTIGQFMNDLKRILRKDDLTTDRMAFLTLGKWDVLKKHLIPILMLTEVEQNPKLVTALVELFVPMTWPLDESLTKELTSQHINHAHVLRQYKESFVKEGVLSKILQLLLRIASIPFRKRQPSDEARIRIILFFLRNLLAVRDSSSTATSSSEKYVQSTLQEQLIVAYKKANVIELILTMAGSLKEREFQDYKAVILEIIYYMFCDRRPIDVLQRHASFIARKNGRLANIHQQASKAIHTLGESLDQGKKTGRLAKMKPALMKQTITTQPKAIVSTEAFEALKETADLFLENAFNSLVDSVKKDIEMERNTLTEVHQIQLLKIITFFLEYQMLKFKNNDSSGRFGFDTVTDILNIRGVAFVLRRVGEYDAAVKKHHELHIAVDCFRQMLMSLDAMGGSENELWREASANLQNNLYYEHSTTELIIRLCKNFKGPNTPYLKSLLETIHTLLQMLKNFSKEKHTMIVRKKKRSKKRKAKRAEEAAAAIDQGQAVEDVVSEDEEDVQKNDEYIEHQFHFEKIESEFASESVVNTYCELLSSFETLEEKYFQMITVMFHRIFVKLDMQAFFFKLSVLELFSRVAKVGGAIARTAGYKEFIQDAQYAYENDSGLTWKQKVTTAVERLVERKHVRSVEWLMITMTETGADRENRTFVDKVNLEDKAFSERQRKLLKSGRHFHILMRLFKFEQSTENPDDPKWFIPETIASDELLENSNIIKLALPSKEDLEAAMKSEEFIVDSDEEVPNVPKASRPQKSIWDDSDGNTSPDESDSEKAPRKPPPKSSTLDLEFDDDLMDAAFRQHEENLARKKQQQPESTTNATAALPEVEKGRENPATIRTADLDVDKESTVGQTDPSASAESPSLLDRTASSSAPSTSKKAQMTRSMVAVYFDEEDDDYDVAGVDLPTAMEMDNAIAQDATPKKRGVEETIDALENQENAMVDTNTTSAPSPEAERKRQRVLEEIELDEPENSKENQPPSEELSKTTTNNIRSFGVLAFDD